MCLYADKAARSPQPEQLLCDFSGKYANVVAQCLSGHCLRRRCETEVAGILLVIRMTAVLHGLREKGEYGWIRASLYSALLVETAGWRLNGSFRH